MTSDRIYSAVALTLLLFGLIALFASAVYSSYVSAIVGLGLAFWGGLFLLVRPTRYVKLELLTVTSSSLVANFEGILTITESSEKGIYLPPKLLRDSQSSLVFIPANSKEALPGPEEIPDERTSVTSEGLFLTPPGLELSRLFEKKMGKSFAELNFDELATELPRLFDEMEITKTTDIVVEGESVTVETRNHIFKDLCMETRKFKRTHGAVGCVFSSAIGCALAKTSGRPVTIEAEDLSEDGRTVTMKYRFVEG
jgi:hypothetical protein